LLYGQENRTTDWLTEDHEVKYWTKKFGACKERLAQAVRRAPAIEADLKRIG